MKLRRLQTPNGYWCQRDAIWRVGIAECRGGEDRPAYDSLCARVDAYVAANTYHGHASHYGADWQWLVAMAWHAQRLLYCKRMVK